MPYLSAPTFQITLQLYSGHLIFLHMVVCVDCLNKTHFDSLHCSADPEGDWSPNSIVVIQNNLYIAANT